MMMEAMESQWRSRIGQAESALAGAFRFTNTHAPVVILDAYYWTFGDLNEEIPDDYYTQPASALRAQLGKIQSHFETIPDDAFIPFLHPWYGTGVLASGFGASLVCKPKVDPAVSLATMESPGDMDRLVMPVPGVSGAMGTVIEIMDYFLAHSRFPVSFTDCQGPMATAIQLVGYDKFCYWMADDPERVHRLMDRISDALIAWVKYQKARAGQPLAGGCFPLGVKVPDGFGGIWISDDDSVMMSPDLYAEFVKPYNEKILAAFGGGCIHYCGRSTQNLVNYFSTKGLTAINNFLMDDLEAAALARRALRDRGIVYMACDYAPADHRLEDYYRELGKAMDGAEGLIVCPCIAPAMALEKGKYATARRHRASLARRIFELVSR